MAAAQAHTQGLQATGEKDQNHPKINITDTSLTRKLSGSSAITARAFATVEEIFTFVSLRFLQDFMQNRSMKYLQRCTQDLTQFSHFHLFNHADPTGLARFLVPSNDIISGAKEEFTDAHAEGVMAVVEHARGKLWLQNVGILSVDIIKAVKSSLERRGLGLEVSIFVKFLAEGLMFEVQNYSHDADSHSTDPFCDPDWLDTAIVELHQSYHGAQVVVPAKEVFQRLAVVMRAIEQGVSWHVKIDCANPSTPEFAAIFRKLNVPEQAIVMNAINSEVPDPRVAELEERMGILMKIGLAMRADLHGV